MSTETVSSRPIVPPIVTLLLDLVAIAVFTLAGAYSHHDEVTAGVYGRILWPFLVGGAIGWVLAYLVSRLRGEGRFDPGRIFLSGLVIWVSTVVFGVIIRWASYADADLVSWFLFITTVVLFILLIGWRVLVIGFYTTRNRSRARD